MPQKLPHVTQQQIPTTTANKQSNKNEATTHPDSNHLICWCLLDLIWSNSNKAGWLLLMLRVNK